MRGIGDGPGRHGRRDSLVNNAGITRDKSLMMMSREDWAQVIETDLNGVFNTTGAGIITFLKQKSGDIVNISSVSGIHPLAGQTNYAAAKAGVIGFTKSLAKEVAPYNVRVNAIAPGFIDTDMTAGLNEKYRDKVMNMIPLQRFGTPNEVAQVVLFLLSERSAYITIYHGRGNSGGWWIGDVRLMLHRTSQARFFAQSRKVAKKE